MSFKLTFNLQFCFVLFLFFFLGFTNATECSIDPSKSQFEIVVLQDNTMRPENQIQNLKDKFANFFHTVQIVSPGSRFGYGVYNTYPETQPTQKNVKSFKALSSLNSHTATFFNAFKTSFNQPTPRSQQQSSLLAIALSAQDKNNHFHWTNVPTTTTGKEIYRVIVLNTETYSYIKGDDHWFTPFSVVLDPKTKEYKKINSREFTESGNEDETFESPSIQQLKNVLKKHKTGLLVLNNNKNVSEFWIGVLRDLGILISTETFSKQNFGENVFEALLRAACPIEEEEESTDSEFEYDSSSRARPTDSEFEFDSRGGARPTDSEFEFDSLQKTKKSV